MNVIHQSILIVITGILLSVSSWYYVHMGSTKRLDYDALISTVDITVFQLAVRQFNTDGLLINQLTAPLMRHTPKNNTHWFKSPYIVVAQDNNQPAWEIHSKKATSWNGGEKIIFKNHVVVHQNSGDKTQESTLKTEEVTYFPQEKKATTDRFVTFEQPGNTIESTGMNAYLDEKRVELLHRARGSYAPAKG